MEQFGAGQDSNDPQGAGPNKGRQLMVLGLGLGS